MSDKRAPPVGALGAPKPPPKAGAPKALVLLPETPPKTPPPPNPPPPGAPKPPATAGAKAAGGGFGGGFGGTGLFAWHLWHRPHLWQPLLPE